MARSGSIFQPQIKTEETFVSSVVEVSELRFWWTADPPRPFQLRQPRIRSAFRLLVAGLPPALIYRRVSRLSPGIAFPFRVTLMVRPHLLAEPGRGDTLSTI